MKGWVGLVGWPAANGLPTYWSPVSCRPSAGQCNPTIIHPTIKPSNQWTDFMHFSTVLFCFFSAHWQLRFLLIQNFYFDVLKCKSEQLRQNETRAVENQSPWDDKELSQFAAHCHRCRTDTAAASPARCLSLLYAVLNSCVPDNDKVMYILI